MGARKLMATGLRDAGIPEAVGEQGASLREYVSQGLKQKGTVYEDYLRLLQDEDLWALMRIPFSAELAEFTRQINQMPVPGAEPGPRPHVEPVKPTSPSSTNETIIRETIARELNKVPSELVESDYARLTRLDLSLSKVSDLTPLQGLTSLQWLPLNQTQVSDAQVA